jgi:hypothetical protein
MASVESNGATDGDTGNQYDLASGAAMNFPKLIWQSPKMFYYAGVYLKLGNKRYRIFKIGER